MSDSISLSLSAHGLSELPPNIYENDFTFIVDGRRYECPSIIADFLSPLLCRLRQSDSSIHEYELNIKDPNDYFYNFISLGRGETISFSRTSRAFYFQICESLENKELLRAFLDKEELTVGTILNRIRTHCALKSDCTAEISFAASHFHEIPISEFDMIEWNANILSSIFSNESLKVKDEDSLVSFLCDFSKRNSTCLSLFDHVRFEYLSRSGLSQFIEIITESFDYFSFSI
jgi:hypothetical protein